MAKVSIKIDKEIHEVLRRRAMEKGFSTTDSYIENVLQQIAAKIIKAEDAKKAQMSKEEEEKVKSRLRALGYIE